MLDKIKAIIAAIKAKLVAIKVDIQVEEVNTSAKLHALETSVKEDEADVKAAILAAEAKIKAEIEKV